MQSAIPGVQEKARKQLHSSEVIEKKKSSPEPLVRCWEGKIWGLQEIWSQISLPWQQAGRTSRVAAMGRQGLEQISTNRGGCPSAYRDRLDRLETLLDDLCCCISTSYLDQEATSNLASRPARRNLPIKRCIRFCRSAAQLRRPLTFRWISSFWNLKAMCVMMVAILLSAVDRLWKDLAREHFDKLAVICIDVRAWGSKKRRSHHSDSVSQKAHNTLSFWLDRTASSRVS